MKNFTAILIILFITAGSLIAQESYKEMMLDNSVNFYDACMAAEAHFAEIDISKKGSGWKGYQRWRTANEYKYYPDGDRSNIDPYFAANAYHAFLLNNPQNKSLFNNGWEELGPFNIDSITGHYAAGLGRIEDLYIDPNNSNRLYVGSRSGGFWKSNDGGFTWEGRTTDFLPASGCDAIGVHPLNSDTLLINVRNSDNGYSHGIYKSEDAGQTFALSNFSPANLGQGGLGSSFRIYKIAYHPTIPHLIFIGTNRGLFRSTDDLASWTGLLASDADITDIAFHPTNPDIVYVLDTDFGNNLRNYVYISNNQGVNFSLSNQIPLNGGEEGILAISPECPSCVYFASDNGVWKSIDEAQNFTFLSEPSESFDGFAVNDQDTNFMIYGYVDIEASSDGGQNFNRVTRWSLGNTNGAGSGHQESYNTSTDYIHADLRVAKCVNGVFYVGTDGLVSRSYDNGANWEVISNGLAVRENYKLGASQSNHFRTISGSQDNGTSIKHKDHWIEFYGADGMEALIHPLNDDWMMGSIQYGSRRRTFDGGQTQGSANAPGQNGSGNSAWEAPLTYDPNNHMRIFNFSDSVFVSDEFGSNYTYRGVPNSFTGTISHAAIAENNSNIIVIAKSDEIDKSIDGGVTFSSIKSNLPNYSIQDIAFDPKNDDIIFVVYARYQEDNRKIYMTDNGGISWTNITYNLGDMPLHSVVVDHTDSSNIYVGAEIGVYTKTRNGNNWSLYNQNLANTTVEELEIVYGSNTLKAATWGRGVWEYSLLGRNDYPAILITKITDQPTFDKPKIGIDQFVTSTISYDNTLSSVYLEWSADTATFGNIITMTNTQDSTWVSDQALPQLAVGTKMFFKVFAVGSANDTSETYKFMYTVQPFDYCATTGTMAYQGNVTLVELNEISNATGKTQPYTDYSSTDSATVYPNKNYEISVNLNTDNGNYEYFARAWIDWNKDADFTDPGEVYDLGSITNQTDAPTNLSPLTFTIPANAHIGSTKMRVACRYNQYPELCENGFDGEVEDYGIHVIPPPNLTFSLDKTDYCQGENLLYEYTGDSVDAVSWEFSNGNSTLSSSSNSGSLVLNETGTYNVFIEATINGEDFSFDSTAVFTVHAPQSVNVSEITCDAGSSGVSSVSYTDQYGCDSTVVTTTTLVSEYEVNLNDTICFGDTYVFNGQNLTQTGVYNYTAPSTSSCDTIYELNLQVNQIDVNVNQFGNDLTAGQSNAAYQWLDCASNWIPIPLADNQTFTPTENGEFAVSISYQNCMDTSQCYVIINLGILDEISNLGLKVFPNPFDENLQISFTEMKTNVKIEVYDALGALIIRENLSDVIEHSLEFDNLTKGVYFLHVTIDADFGIIEVMKN